MELAAPTAQLAFFDVPAVLNATTVGSARYAYGEAAQNLVYAHLGIERIPIDSKKTVCFDGYQHGTYFEIKSLHFQKGKVVLFKARMEKDQAAGVPLDYLLVLHRLQGERTDITRAMASAPIVFYVVPASAVHSATEGQSLRTVSQNGSNGYNKEGYREGYYNLTLKRVIEGINFVNYEVDNQLGEGLMTLHVAESAAYAPVNIAGIRRAVA